jgi:hypothetical protein
MPQTATLAATSANPQPVIPARHGADPREARRMAASLRLILRNKRAAEPPPERWRAMGLSLLDGDPPADRLVQWMLATGMAKARPLFERALEQGVDSLPHAPAALKDFFAHVQSRPSWVDDARLLAGARACHISGLTGMRMMRDLGLMAGYQASAINKTLVMTGSLERGAQRRVAETTKWWMDVTTPGGLERFGEGFKTTVRVRLMHALVRHQVARRPDWRIEEWGLPVNQADMMATYLGFSVVFLIGQRYMGVTLNRQESEDVMHLWKYIGWLMGVDEAWLYDSEEAGRVALYQNILTQAPPDESSRQLGRALMDEPLSRHYRYFQGLRRRYERALHLSICRAFLGARGMRALGLPRGVLPWYPVIFAPCNWLWHRVHRLVPGGRELLVRRGRRHQVAQLRVAFGEGRPDIAALHAAAGQH